MSDEISFPDWLTSTQEVRDALDAFARSTLPADASERHADMDKSIQSADDAGRLLADSESYLSLAKAQALMALLQRDDLNAKDRDTLLRSDVRGVQRIVDGLAVTERSIRNRIFVGMNANRSRL